MSHPILRVAVFAPLPGYFDYLPPARGEVLPGMRVAVPFGRGQRVGLVLAGRNDSAQPVERLKPIDQLLDDAPLCDAAHLDFLAWTASYYQHPPGEVFAAALPALLRVAGPRPEIGRPGWRVCVRASDLAAPRRAPRQWQLLALLTEHGSQGLAQDDLTARFGACRGLLLALRDKGLIEAVTLDQPANPRQPEPGPPLNAEQQQALLALFAEPGFRVHLLEGVTGSGKTEIYLEASRRVIAQGRQVLVLVPEIALTPQTTQRFAARLGQPPLVLHSALNGRERTLAWLWAASGSAPLLLGTRSAVLTPLPRLGLVIVDEEHDLSFKQQEGFRYSGRDLAVVRGQRAGCPVLLGSATPSMESLHNCLSGRFRRLALDQRAGNALPPELRLLDIRSAPLEAGLSRPLLHAMGERLRAGEQVLLFLNRRGYAPVLICHDCGWIAQCRHCDARLTVHRAEGRLCCHHCGQVLRLPNACPDCAGARLIYQGIGTEQLQDYLSQRFPDHSLARIDRDSTRRKGSLQQLLEQVRLGQHQILLGTQMLAKGHDFPNVTLVGLVDVDQGLFGADFRSTERMAQLIIQVAGRAGRAEKPGLVLIQTRQADHPLLTSLIHRGYPPFAREILRERHSAALPPFSHQALLRADARQPVQAETFLQQVADLARELDEPRVELWGPAPAVMERRAGRHRQQLLLQCGSRPLLQGFLGRLLGAMAGLKPPAGLRWSLDVDPQEML